MQLLCASSYDARQAKHLLTTVHNRGGVEKKKSKFFLPSSQLARSSLVPSYEFLQRNPLSFILEPMAAPPNSSAGKNNIATKSQLSVHQKYFQTTGNA